MKNLKLFALVLSLLIFSAFTSCVYVSHNGVKGNGNIIKKHIDVKDFTEVDISGAYKIILTQGDKNDMVLEADENLMKYLKVTNEGNELEVKVSKSINPSKTPRIYMTFKTLNSIELSGACSISGANDMKFNELNLEASGASKIALNMKADKLKMELSGASSVKLQGKADEVYISCSGAGTFSAEDFLINICDIELSGAANAKVYVTGTLGYEVNGASHLLYKGSPKITKSEVSGVSSAKAVN